MRLAEYKRYRLNYKALENKLIKAMLGPEDIARAERILGMEVGGDGGESYSEAEMACRTDMALCDIKDESGRNKVQAYLEDVGPATEMDRKMLEMRAGARTSLFRVEACDPLGMMVTLSDQLRGGRGEVTMYDGGISDTVPVGFSIFTRIHDSPDTAMTWGTTFGFRTGLAPAMIKKYRRMRETPSRRGPASRFALFFRLNHRYGVPTKFA